MLRNKTSGSKLGGSKKNGTPDAYSDDIAISIRLNELAAKLIRKRIPDIPFSSRKRVLDVGCGISPLGKTFSDQVYGFDLNPKSVGICRKQGMIVRVGNAEKKWKYPDKYFDIVILSHIIEHVVNTDHLIQEAKRVLKKDGIIIVNTPNLAAWFNRLLLLVGFQPFFTEVSTIDKTLGLKFSRKINPMYSPPLGHLRVFTTRALRDLLEFHGIRVTKVSGLEFYILPKFLLFFDILFSYIPGLSSSVIMLGKKDESF